jgi:hypothetical protein
VECLGARDTVLKLAEKGVPMIWSRAAHHLYPAHFRRHARRLLLAMSSPLYRYEVQGLPAGPYIRPLFSST